MKWSFLILCIKEKFYAAWLHSKQHCAFWFWKEKLMTNSNNLLNRQRKRRSWEIWKITSLKDLPSKSILKNASKKP